MLILLIFLVLYLSTWGTRSFIGEKNVIIDRGSDLKVRVSIVQPPAGTAFATGTLSISKGGFIPVKVYLFQMVNEKNDAEGLKKLAVFFFATLMDTELYVAEIPLDSALFRGEARRFFGA